MKRRKKRLLTQDYRGNMNTVVKFKDGDDDEFETELESVSVEVIDNGYFVTFSYTDEEVKEVYQYKDRKEMIESLTDKLGV